MVEEDKADRLDKATRTRMVRGMRASSSPDYGPSPGDAGPRCPECGVEMTESQKLRSLWGMCKPCENARLGDVAAG